MFDLYRSHPIRPQFPDPYCRIYITCIFIISWWPYDYELHMLQSHSNIFITVYLGGLNRQNASALDAYHVSWRIHYTIVIAMHKSMPVLMLNNTVFMKVLVECSASSRINVVKAVADVIFLKLPLNKSWRYHVLCAIAKLTLQVRNHPNLLWLKYSEQTFQLEVWFFCISCFPALTACIIINKWVQCITAHTVL